MDANWLRLSFQLGFTSPFHNHWAHFFKSLRPKKDLKKKIDFFSKKSKNNICIWIQFKFRKEPGKLKPIVLDLNGKNFKLSIPLVMRNPTVLLKLKSIFKLLDVYTKINILSFFEFDHKNHPNFIVLELQNISNSNSSKS